jgi:hypothetical protein
MYLHILHDIFYVDSKGFWQWCMIIRIFLSHGVRLSPLGTAATLCRIVPAADDRRRRLWSNRCNAS